MDYAKYWNNRYAQGGNSGYGSYDEQLQKKLHWLSGLDIKSVSEVGCGDFNFGFHLMEKYPNASYYGTDISDVIITQNISRFPKYYFGFSNEDVSKSDLILCIDVLFHTLKDEDYEKTLNLLEDLFNHGKYLAITAYEYNQEIGLAPHVKIRKFDYRRFGEPLIRETVEEDGDLKFFLFRR